MDETLDALAARLKGRHLVDEILHFMRDHDNGSGLREKVSSSASSVMHATTGAVRAHPWPALLIGAGLAWLLYERNQPEEETISGSDDPQYRSDTGEGLGAADESSTFERGREAMGRAAHQTTESVRHAAGRVASRAQQGARKVQDKLQTAGARAQERGREMYARSRKAVARNLDEHPLEAGLVSLALGVIAGIATPNPQAVDEMAGSAADRLKQRARDLAQRGNRVVQAATQAAKQEAREQGLTPTAEKAGPDRPGSGSPQAASDASQPGSPAMPAPPAF